MIEADHTENCGQQQHAPQGAAAAAPGVQKAGVSTGFAAYVPAAIRCQQEHHTGNRQEVAGGINPQGPGRSDCGHQPATDWGAHQLPHVEHHRKAGEIARQLFGLFHQDRAVLVAGRQFVGTGDPHQQRAEQQQHHLGCPLQQGNGKSPQPRCRQQGPLGLHQHPLTAHPVGAHAGRATDQQGGQR